jgi:ATP-binding cassette subfamily C protein CydCD
VTAEAERGDWLVVTGPSGSGKSTLLAVLLRYLRPSGGSYLLDGRPASSVRAESIRGLIAWCPQEGHLFDSTLRANLLLARPHDEPPTDAELVESMRRVGLGELLAGLPAGLDTPIGSDGSFLSGGQRQRVAVARTLLARSDVVLVDEPTAHLDEESAAALIADLRSSLAAKTVVLVSHRPSEVLPGDRLLDLDSARRSRAGREVSRIGG